MLLGTLGNLMHLRCRACGLDSSIVVKRCPSCDKMPDRCWCHCT
jgi:lipopolysaccharide biosynthesis regulator YciM